MPLTWGRHLGCRGARSSAGFWVRIGDRGDLLAKFKSRSAEKMFQTGGGLAVFSPGASRALLGLSTRHLA